MIDSRVVEIKRDAATLARADDRLARASNLAGDFPLNLRPAGFATLLWVILGQQVSIAAAAAMEARLAATLGTVGDLILADWSQYQMIDKGGIKGASSMHVRFLQDEMVYKFTYRINGQPTWDAALTPYKGTNTVSPFVTLDTRA